MKKRIFLSMVFLIAVTFALITTGGFTAEDQAEEIKLYMGEIKILPVSTPTRIVIANPNIIDVANVTKSEMTLIPKAAGSTTLLFWDNFGEQSYKVKVFSEDMFEIQSRVDKLLANLDFPEVSSRVQEEENKVMLLGRVKTPQEKERITLALGTLKEKTIDLIEVKEEETLIEIEAQVLELDKDAISRLGFTLPSSVNITEVGSPAITSTGSVSTTTGSTPSSSFTSTTTGTTWGKLFRILNVSREAFTTSIDALVIEGKARILSRPRLACQSGKEAELLVGGEKPTFATMTAETGSGVEIEYKEYGIKLKIKPNVMEGERIKLGLNIEISEVGEAETIGTTTSVTAKAYPLTKRNISTELFVNNEQTLAIGGLIKQRTDEEVRKTPFLGDVPIFGLFFRKKTVAKGGGAGNKGDTELFITLTPTIIARENPQAKKTETSSSQEKESAKNIISAGGTGDPIKDYALIVQRRILDNLRYPNSAKEADFQGAVKLSLRLSYTGELLEVAVKESSGHKMLDDNAINAASEISSYPPFPPSIEQNELWIDVPIAYRLD